MARAIVLTLTGPDRVGLVEAVTGALLGVGANVGPSRMARLGGEFAVLMLATVPDAADDGLTAAFSGLSSQGYAVSWVPAGASYDESRSGWLPYLVEVRGADHEGIVHEVARELSRRGISIESAETATTEAPVTGSPLFSMTASVLVPPQADERAWREELAGAAAAANVDVDITAL